MKTMYPLLVKLILSTVLCVAEVLPEARPRSKDYQLSIDLLADYPAGYNVLPVENPHDVVNVSFQMALYSIVDMVNILIN